MDSTQFMLGMLESLGWAILHSFWQMALIWLIFQIFFGNRKPVSPLLRHHAAVLGMLIGTLWFAGTFIKEYNSYLSIGRYLAMVPEPLPETSSLVNPVHGFGAVIEFLSVFAREHIAWLSAVYLFLLALTGWKLLRGCLQIHTLRSAGLVAATPDLQKQVLQLAQQLSIPFGVQVHLSRLVDVPATLGILKPVILLPVSCVTQLSAVQLESILLHELAHIRRMDYLVNLVVGLMETLLVHNPFAWWFARCIRRERELCCDDIVLSHRQDALEYASALLSLEKHRRLPQAMMAMASNGEQGHLLQRIRRITSSPSPGTFQGQRLVAVVLMFLFMLSMAWIGPTNLRASTRSVSATQTEISQVILVQPPGDISRTTKPGERITVTTKRVMVVPNRAPRVASPKMPAAPELTPASSSPKSPRIFMNEAPPESFVFAYKGPAEEEALLLIPALPEVQSPLPSWIPENQQRRISVPDAHVRVQQELRSIQQQQQALEHMIQVEREREQSLALLGMARTRKASGQVRSSVPRAISPRISPPPAPEVTEIDRIFKDKAWDPEVWQEIYRQRQPEEQVRRVLTPRIPRKEAAKVNRIKTRDGYTLRIVTGKESIDFRIGENDVVVEKD